MFLVFSTLSRLVVREGNVIPLQYSCLENPMDGGAWWAVVHGVAQSQTWLKRLSSSSSTKSCSNLRPHGLQHMRLPCPPLSPGVCSNSCPLSQWGYLTISSFASTFSCYLQSFPASGSFLMSQLCATGSQTIGDLPSASALLMYIQGWFI